MVPAVWSLSVDLSILFILKISQDKANDKLHHILQLKLWNQTELSYILTYPIINVLVSGGHGNRNSNE